MPIVAVSPGLEIVMARVTRHASARAAEAAEFFDVEVDELSRMFLLVAHNGRWRQEEA
jgi:hypothetical protein